MFLEGNYQNQYFSALTQINEENIDGIMFYSGRLGAVYARYVGTGEEFRSIESPVGASYNRQVVTRWLITE